jgi:uncharacterized protein DUF1579
MKRSNIAIVAVLLCTTAPLAIGQLSAQESGAASPSARLDGFVGDGTCTAKMVAMGGNPARTSTGKFHGEKTLDGHWAVIRYDEDRTATNTKPFSVVQYVGYDDAKRRFVTVQLDNTGGSYITGVGSGWKGNSITFDETMLIGGKPTPARDVFISGDGGMATHLGQMRDAGGKWITMDTETCHKS